MMDVPILFGRHDNLVGIAGGLSEDGTGSDVGVLMLTPGMLHSAGPYRLHVEIANKLAASGVSSFRFDLSGIGESLAVGSDKSSLDRASDETRQAMDALTSAFGIRDFVLFGLCSGADDGFYTALRDPRIIGLVMMDGFGYPTKRFRRQRIRSHFLPRLLSLSKWRTFLKGRFGKTESVPTSLRVGDDIREFPSREEASQQLKRLIERDVMIRLIYTGGVGHYYNYAEQYREMFPDVDMEANVSSVFFSDMDHVAILREDRDKLVESIVRWIDETFSDRGRRLAGPATTSRSPISDSTGPHRGSKTIVR